MYTEGLYPTLETRYIETLALRGQALHALELHLARVRRTLSRHSTPHGRDSHPLLEALEPQRILEQAQQKLGEKYHPLQSYKLSYTYDAVQLISCHISPYQPKLWTSLILLNLPEGFDYSYKYADRRFFDQAHQGLPETCLPLFLLPDGQLSDSSYTNIVLDLEGELLTPERPLLEGTERQRLIHSGQIRPAPLGTSELLAARKLYLINALMPLEEAPYLRDIANRLLAHE